MHSESGRFVEVHRFKSGRIVKALESARKCSRRMKVSMKRYGLWRIVVRSGPG